MAKLDCCDRCKYYARNPFLICAEHPTGVEGEHCPDFELDLEIPDDEATAWYGEQWQPEGASYYGDELILDPVQRLTLEQRLELLDTHPLFTGRCPNCERPVPRATDGQVHWDCEHCGWVDDSV
jgi:hypothetical protein